MRPPAHLSTDPRPYGPRGADRFQYRVDRPGDFSVAIHRVMIDPAIMPLGDSITAGLIGVIRPLNARRVAYRSDLFEDLTAAGFRVDFVGSQHSGDAASPPPGDADHEGHPGLSALDIADHVRTWLALNPADVVLLHAGTNSINSDGFDPVTRAAHVAQILDEIDRWEQDTHTPVTVFLALIIDRSNEDGSFPNPRVDAYNHALLAMVAGRPHDTIEIVDQHHALDYSCADGVCDMTPQTGQSGDTVFVHPTQQGYQKLANRWLKRVMASGKVAKCS